ncbi:MAG: tol-pal system-associated acyl-CoA thioesterase [Gammaproteobacteria bacterium]|nr:tol-pal system-associated acyl-CoA thioesterase [Gammaproteobacteria bacterium]
MFLWPVRVYYEDTDSGGVVYYANYLRFLERARTEFLRSLGFEQDRLIEEEGLIFVVRSVNIDYLRPACFNDRLLVSAVPGEPTGAGLRFSQRIWRADDLTGPSEDSNIDETKCLCRAEVRVVCLDRATMRPRRLPEAMKEILE